MFSHDSESRVDFARLWLQAQPVVAGLIRSIVRRSDDADDVLQEVACTAAMEFDQFDRERSFTAWTIGIARNKLREMARSQRSHRAALDAEFIETVADAYSRSAPQLSMMAEAVEHCMQKAPLTMRKLLTMRYLHDLKPAAIATEIGSTPNHVAVLLYRARKSIRDCVERFVDRASTR